MCDTCEGKGWYTVGDNTREEVIVCDCRGPYRTRPQVADEARYLRKSRRAP